MLYHVLLPMCTCHYFFDDGMNLDSNVLLTETQHKYKPMYCLPAKCCIRDNCNLCCDSMTLASIMQANMYTICLESIQRVLPFPHLPPTELVGLSLSMTVVPSLSAGVARFGAFGFVAEGAS
jgi:hypothetical protein